MVMTMLEAHVEKDKWAVLEATYGAAVESLDPRLVRSYLVQSIADPTLWRMMGVWTSRETFEQMRASGETPRGILIFRAAGAEPELSLYSVVAEGVQNP
jgi:hypothetical protein